MLVSNVILSPTDVTANHPAFFQELLNPQHFCFLPLWLIPHPHYTAISSPWLWGMRGLEVVRYEGSPAQCFAPPHSSTPLGGRQKALQLDIFICEMTLQEKNVLHERRGRMKVETVQILTVTHIHHLTRLSILHLFFFQVSFFATIKVTDHEESSLKTSCFMLQQNCIFVWLQTIDIWYMKYLSPSKFHLWVWIQCLHYLVDLVRMCKGSAMMGWWQRHGTGSSCNEMPVWRVVATSWAASPWEGGQHTPDGRASITLRQV